MKSLKLITMAYLSMFQSFCMQISETFLDKPYVICQETQTFKKELIKPYILEIEHNEIGNNLTKKICELYEKVEKKCGYIIFRKGDQTSFCPHKNEHGQIELIIDIVAIDEYKYPLIQRGNLPDYLGISGMISPFMITLAHELIHLKHKLEEIANVCDSGEITSIPYSIAKIIGIENIFDTKYSYLFPLLPELQEVRLNMTELWPNLEERRTVIGPDIDDISEHTLRKSMGISSRFIYQSKDIISLEKQETISKIINDPILSTCLIKSEVSILTPLDILLKLGKKEEILSLLDEHPILPLTKKIFSIILNDSITYNFISKEIKSFMEELLLYKPKPLIFDFKW